MTEEEESRGEEGDCTDMLPVCRRRTAKRKQPPSTTTGKRMVTMTLSLKMKARGGGGPGGLGFDLVGSCREKAARLFVCSAGAGESPTEPSPASASCGGGPVGLGFDR